MHTSNKCVRSQALPALPRTAYMQHVLPLLASPAHEHFITNLIKQKIFINIERLQLSSPTNFDKVFVLYLPMNEIHELGLLYLHFELLFGLVSFPTC